MPQGKLHNLLFIALQQGFRKMDLGDMIIATQATVVLRTGDAYDPGFALLRPEHHSQELPGSEDVLWGIEISVSSRSVDLNTKKKGYSEAGVPTCWVVDTLKRGVWVFSNPVEGEHRGATFVPAGAPAPVPGTDITLATDSVFPR